jgi:hypothetical protein
MVDYADFADEGADDECTDFTDVSTDGFAV